MSEVKKNLSVVILHLVNRIICEINFLVLKLENSIKLIPFINYVYFPYRTATNPG